MNSATKGMLKRVTRYLATFALLSFAFGMTFLWVFHSSALSLVVIRGTSMEPTFFDGQRVLLSQSKEMKDGLIVVFPAPKNWGIEGNPELIKRIAAKGGDTVTYDGSQLFVNGNPIFNLQATGYSCDLPEGYSHTLSETEVFAVGDNHLVSFDSLRVLCENDPTKTAYVSTSELTSYGTIWKKF